MKPIFKIVSVLFLLSLNLEALPLKLLAWDDEIAGRKLAVAYGEESVAINYMHPSARTEAVKVPAGAVNLRIEALDLPAVEGKLPSALVKIPEGVKHPLVLVLPDKKAAAGLRTLVIEDDLSALAWGATSLINATGKPLVFRYGDKGVPLNADWKPVQVKPTSDAKSMQVKIYLADNMKKAAYSAVWTYNDGVRKLVFLIPNPDPSLGLIAFKFINEKRVVVEAAQSKGR